MLVVIAEHGLTGTCIWVGDDIVQAVETARSAEKMGYRFPSSEQVAVVIQDLRLGRALNKRSVDETYVFTRSKSDSPENWKEEWHNYSRHEEEFKRRT